MLAELLQILKPINLLDIAIIAIVTYKIMEMLKGTRAVQLIKGLIVLLLISIISDAIGLTTVNWVLVQLQTLLLISIPIVFQPEMRRGLEQLGKSSFFSRRGRSDQKHAEVVRNVNEMVRCMTAASKTKTGVLMVIKREIGLAEYVATGIPIGGFLTAELLGNIFIVNTPLHDGAVIIDGDKILAASCYLPLSENQNISKELGTRHRAAIGLSEATDALSLIVSEETGAMSVAIGGHLYRDLKENKLRELLIRKLDEKPTEQLFWDKWRKKQ